MTAALAPARVSPELEPEVLAALRIPRRPSLYLTPSRCPAHDDCFLVIDSEGPHPHGQVLGLAIPAVDGGWRLGCTRCYEPVTWDSTGRGLCRDCAAGQGGGAS